MSIKERWVLVSILSAVIILISVDILGDAKEGVDLWHVLLEGSVGIVSLFGIFYVLKDFFKTKKNLYDTHNKFSLYKEEAEKWRADSRKYLDGLSGAIDEQLQNWNLTIAEKEIAFLLLKGLSLKEIAHLRNTTEKTARTQSMSIYLD